jgi:LacI family transcriptional regulator
VLTNVREVAALAGVSVGTVSNVFNRPDKVATATAIKVQSAIEQLGFVRNDAARRLRAGRSLAIGLIALDIASPFFTDLARGAQQAAASVGRSVILGNTAQNTDHENEYLDLFESQRVDGVLLAPLGEPAERLRQLRKNGIASVLIDRLSSDPSFSSVSVDHVAGGAMAVLHLIEQGRKRVAFVGGPFSLPQVADRLKGAGSAASASRDVTIEVLATTELSIDEGLRAGNLIASREARARPDAVFAANDLVAIGLLQAFLLNDSITVPADIAIVGYDDISFARSTAIALTSIHQPAELVGETSVKILLGEAHNHAAFAQHVVLQPSLVARQSSLSV